MSFSGWRLMITPNRKVRVRILQMYFMSQNPFKNMYDVTRNAKILTCFWDLAFKNTSSPQAVADFA